MVKNRLVVAPMTTWSSHEDGSISEGELDFIRRRAGYGIFMTAACYVQPQGHAFAGQWSCSRDEDLPSLMAAREAIHETGALAVLQIHHGGRMCPAELCGGEPVSASSVRADRPYATTPRAMTHEEIETTIEAFGQAARRAREAGYDGVEIHGANTYLLQQFVSPMTNLRDDYWGEDRLRFPLAVTDAVFAAVGPNFPVGYRFSPEESEPEGITLAHTFELLDELIQRPLAWLHISLRDFRMGSLRGEFDDPILARVNRHIAGRVPFIGVGSVKTVEEAEACLEHCDLVAIGREAIVEPDWVQNALVGVPPRTRIALANAARELVIPEGLMERIRQTAGWFDLEDPVAA